MKKHYYFSALFLMLLLSIVPTSYANWNNSLQAYYSFEPNTLNATSIRPSISAGNFECSIFGGTPTNQDSVNVSAIGQAIYVNGATGFNCPRNLIANGTNTMTVAFWMQANDTVSASRGIIGNLLSSNSGYYFRRDATGNLVVFKGSGSLSPLTLTATRNTSWNHIVSVNNATGMFLFVNGVLATSNAITDNFATGTNRTGVGFFADGPTTNSEFWNGKIDELGVWYRSLNGTEVTQLYNGGSGFNPFGNITQGNATNITITAPTYGNVQLKNYTLTYFYNTTQQETLNSSNGVVFVNFSDKINAGSPLGLVNFQGYIVSSQQNANLNVSVYYFNQSTGSFNYSVVNVSAQNAYNNAFLSNFSAKTQNATAETFTASNISLILNFNSAYTINVSKNGFFDNVSNISTNATFIQFASRLINKNNITVNFFDEDTLLPVNSVAWQILATNPGEQSRSGTTGANSFTVEGLSGNFEIRYNASTYEPRSYYFTMPLTLETDANLSLFLLKSDRASSVLVKVTDKNNQFIDGLTVSLLRRYSVANQTQFYVVEQSRPVSQLAGQTLFSVVPNTIPYVFRVTNEAGQILYQGAAQNSNNYETTYIINSQLFIKLESGTNIINSFREVGNAQIALSNTSNAFIMSFENTEGQFSGVCLQTRRNDREIVNNQCSTADSGILTYTFTPDNNSYYVASAIVVSDQVGQQTVALSVIDNTATRSEIMGLLGVFFLFVTIAAFSLAFAFNPTIMILMQVIAIVAFGANFLGIVAVGPVVQGTVLILGIVIAIVLNHRGFQ